MMCIILIMMLFYSPLIINLYMHVDNINEHMPCDYLISLLPPADLTLALCENSVLPTLGLGRRDYWDEINPILWKWQSFNDSGYLTLSVSVSAGARY